jgi:dihydroneopterin aldolase
VEDVSDHILINGLRVVSVIGVLDHERESAQPLQIDADIHVDLREAGQSDDLTQTVHYGEVCMQLAAVARATSDQLLERLAQRMADVVLPEDVQSSAVRIHRVAIGTNE